MEKIPNNVLKIRNTVENKKEKQKNERQKQQIKIIKLIRRDSFKKTFSSHDH